MISLILVATFLGSVAFFGLGYFVYRLAKENYVDLQEGYGLAGMMLSYAMFCFSVYFWTLFLFYNYKFFFK